ncbi:MAG TPA: hypothetical protein PKW37_01970 [Salinivirgaceae bacterium]|nr:hypothetical protein [Salinivirgaceae bacterium]
MQIYGYTEQLYFIRDTSQLFKVNDNPQRYNKILNYLFDLKGDERIDGVFGVPISCIVNKQNRLKIMKYKYEEDSILRNRPFPLYELTTTDIKGLDYYGIEISNDTLPGSCYRDECE